MIAWRATSLKAMFCGVSLARRDDDRMAHALGVGERPLQRLHGAERAADHRGEALDAEAVGEPRLRLDPVLHCHHREVGAPGLAGRGLIDAGPVEPKQLPM